MLFDRPYKIRCRIVYMILLVFLKQKWFKYCIKEGCKTYKSCLQSIYPMVFSQGMACNETYKNIGTLQCNVS